MDNVGYLQRIFGFFHPGLGPRFLGDGDLMEGFGFRDVTGCNRVSLRVIIPIFQQFRILEMVEILRGIYGEVTACLSSWVRVIYSVRCECDVRFSGVQ